MKTGSTTELLIQTRPSWCGKLQKNQHHWSSKNDHPTIRSCHCFLGPVWSPITRISSTKHDCHFSFIFQYPCQVANGQIEEASRMFKSRSHFTPWQCVASHHWCDPNFVKKYEAETLKHSPYSLDFTLSNFHAFPSLKGNLGGMHLMEEELTNTVRAFCSNRRLSGYYRGIQNGAKWRNKCLDSAGNYVEK